MQVISIARAINRLTGEAGSIVRESVSAWRSITFSGERTEVTLSFAGIHAAIAGEDLLTRLSDTDTWQLAGRTVIDIEVVSIERIGTPLTLTIMLSVLTLDMPEGSRR